MTGALAAGDQPPVSVLMYHQVGKFPQPRQHRATFCDVDRFRAQMRFLHYAGYQVISLQQCLAGVFGSRRLPKRAVVLTFDDGYQNFAEFAYPILRRYRFPATVFLVAGLLGRAAQWLLDDGRAGPALMDSETIRRLAADGVSFGAHSITHPRLSVLSPAQQQQEIITSKRHLEDVLDLPVEDFCYPYGDYDQHCRELVERAGYRSALTCIRGAANTASNCFEIPRKAISYGDSVVGMWWKLQFKHRRKET